MRYYNLPDMSSVPEDKYDHIAYEKALKHDDILRVLSVFLSATFAGLLMFLYCRHAESSWLAVLTESSSFPESLILMLLFFFAVKCYLVEYFCPPIWSGLLGVLSVFIFYNMVVDFTWYRWLLSSVLISVYTTFYFEPADESRHTRITDILQKIAFLLLGLCLAMGIAKIWNQHSEKINQEMQATEFAQYEAYDEYYS